ncbi:UbiA prenyltransferase family-domain-containing protein [Trametes maxima]|nr:UbiA prenyltransferase family-domain-containing protein [Trametes maxima]
MSATPATLPSLFSLEPVLRASSIPLLIRNLCSALRYHAHTALLFTVADIKTILLPISAFACATAPLHSPTQFLKGLSWIWLHQLMCNVSNQARSRAEDVVNKPWRPLPSNRVTEEQARWLRWIVVGLCFSYSGLYGPDLVAVTAGLFLTTFMYDEGGLAAHYIGKSFCNIGGYTTLEVGATKLMGATKVMDDVSTTAVCISGLLIFTTIQAQDFADVEGDSALGRRTFPIYAPRLSRAVTLIGIPGWALFLAYYWGVGPLFSTAFVALASYIGARYFFLREAEQDKRSYVLYNVWLTIAHIMPIHARTGVFSF